MSCLLENVSHVKSQAPTPSPPFNVQMKMTKKSQPLATLHEKWRLMVVTCWLPKLLLNYVFCEVSQEVLSLIVFH